MVLKMHASTRSRRPSQQMLPAATAKWVLQLKSLRAIKTEHTHTYVGT